MQLGARMAMWGGPRKYDVQDYAGWGTSSLLAMWDGIRNVGASAAHDSSSTTWTDLSGHGYNFSLNTNRANGAFSADGIYSTGSNMMASYVGAFDYGGTNNSYIEVVFSFASSVKENWGVFVGFNAQGGTKIISACAFDARYTSSSLGRNCFYYGIPYGRGQNVTDSSQTYSAGVHQFRGSLSGTWLDDSAPQGTVMFPNNACVSNTNQTFKAITIGGVYFSTTSPTSGGMVIGNLPSGTQVKCVRIYSSPLTYAQMAQNYAIDRARFNIT